jgi:MFS family permease
LNGTAFIWFSTLTAHSSYASVLVSMILFGFGMALFASPNTSSIMGSVPAEKRGIANGIRMTVAQTAGVLCVPFSLMLMTLVMPYNRLSQIISNSQLSGANEIPVFLRAVNHACFILGIIVFLAIIPSLLRGPKEEGVTGTK